MLRADSDYREFVVRKYSHDVDEVVYPERLGAAGAKTALLGGDFNVLADITEQLSAASVEIPEGADAVVMVEETESFGDDVPFEDAVREHAREEDGMRSLQASARRVVLDGESSIEEMMRVVAS